MLRLIIVYLYFFFCCILFCSKFSSVFGGFFRLFLLLFFFHFFRERLILFRQREHSVGVKEQQRKHEHHRACRDKEIGKITNSETKTAQVDHIAHAVTNNIVGCRIPNLIVDSVNKIPHAASHNEYERNTKQSTTLVRFKEEPSKPAHQNRRERNHQDF